MHIHHTVPWPLVALLVVCMAVGACQLRDRAGRDDARAHLLMNFAMAAMALDASMALGQWWLTIAVGVASIVALTYIRRPDSANAVHVVAAVVMVAATAMMLTGTTGSVVAIALAGIVLLDVAGTVVLAAAGRVATTPDGIAVSVAAARTRAIPHIGMGVGMIAMLVGS